MEIWRIHKYCERATIEELFGTERALTEAIREDRLGSTNAKLALAIVKQYIEIRRVFGDLQ